MECLHRRMQCSALVLSLSLTGLQVFSEAENRMHAQNGVLLHAMDSLAGL